MEREYKNSVKGRLTKYLVLVVTLSVLLIFAIIAFVQIQSAYKR